MIERASPEDMTSLASDRGPAPMQVGAILVLDTPDRFDVVAAIGTLEARIRAVPRLRQRLVAVPFGCGRPIWVDDPAFEISRHVHVVDCPGDGDEAALLSLAADISVERLPSDRPLWSATFVRGLRGSRHALIVVFHHVMADGLGGLAVLAALVDGQPEAVPGELPRPMPSAAALALDAARSRIGSLIRPVAMLRRFRDALAELRGTRPQRPPRSTLNRPTGAHRRFAVVRVELAPTLAVARAHDATVNDVVLCAVGGSLRTLLASRGEEVDRFVVSVLVSGRRRADMRALGNQVGVLPTEVDASGGRARRLEAAAAAGRRARRAPRGASAALLGPVLRILARVGLFRWFVDRQRLVNSFVTNLRGPDRRLEFAGRPIREILPIANLSGNVTVSFAVLSYAGTLGIMVIADADECPDLPILAAALRREFASLVGP